ncbi:MAG: hypothetical protein COB30_012555 [Ectothiorhodospiraceae bacterium]|nr:hypothetical protein [Ectothiorhodospiraceae bacterium]
MSGLLLLVMSFMSSVNAGDVEIVNVSFESRGDNWHVDVTLKHNDKGWDHYADAWRVVTEKGALLGKRTLHHPHEKEQPFTRSLRSVPVPKGVTVVFVEAHDKVHGWSKQRVRVDLRQAKGRRYEVKR